MPLKSGSGAASGADGHDNPVALATNPTQPGSIVMISRLSKLLVRRTSDELLGGMTWRHFVALAHLRDYGLTSQQDMCIALFMDANNLVLLLNELEYAGYAERRRDPADRRRHLVELTSTGRRALERAERAREGIEDELFRGLSPDERQTFRTLLQKVLQTADR